VSLLKATAAHPTQPAVPAVHILDKNFATKASDRRLI